MPSVCPAVRPALLTAAASVATGAGWWTVRHRSSEAVRRWRPPALAATRARALHVRRAGDTGPVVVLLHGLVATGDVFGAEFDALADRATLVVPDMLGFGRSLDERRTEFSAEDHLDALDEMLDELGLDDRPLVLGAHSMGGSVAIRWARRRGPQVRHVVCWGAPVYRHEHGLDDALRGAGIMARLFVADTALARAACEFNCAHRTLAGWAAAAITPTLPVPIARAASLHTWPAYRDAIQHLVSDTDWESCVRVATDAGTTVQLVWGTDDRVGDRDHASTLAGAKVEVVAGAGHHLPMTHAARCREQLGFGR